MRPIDSFSACKAKQCNPSCQLDAVNNTKRDCDAARTTEKKASISLCPMWDAMLSRW